MALFHRQACDSPVKLTMIDAISRFFNKHIKLTNNVDSASGQHALQLASAALLIEMTRVDETIDKEEVDAVTAAIKNEFDLSNVETDELVRLATEEAGQSTCYYEFTSLINREFSQQQKIRLVELMWQVAYADKVIHMHEDHLVRKISELLHVSHKDFIAAKLRAQRDA